MNDIVVHKFGGSCLRDGNDIDKSLKLSVVQKETNHCRVRALGHD